MYGKCTVYFENPYWIGIFERTDENVYSVVRYVFGSEPTEVEIYQFINHNYKTLSFSTPEAVPENKEHEIGFKRRQRLTRQQVNEQGIGTYAQRAIQAERERMKRIRHEETRQERETLEKEKFFLKLAKKKEKHRGH